MPAKKVITIVGGTSKEAVESRAPLQLTPVFEEQAEKMLGTGILTSKRLTNDGNPAVVVQTDSWYGIYGTQFFAVDQVNGNIDAIKDGGQWELTKEKATIDTDSHHIVISTTPIAGNKMVDQCNSLGETLLVRQNKVYL